MKKVIFTALRLYKIFFSPLIHSLGGGHYGGCRFFPTCSEYCYDAIKRYGLVQGSGKSLWRLLRCHPLSVGGLDMIESSAYHKKK